MTEPHLLGEEGHRLNTLLSDRDHWTRGPYIVGAGVLFLMCPECGATVANDELAPGIHTDWHIQQVEILEIIKNDIEAIVEKAGLV